MKHYNQIKVLGEGGYGKAILAQNILTKEKCVIKEIQFSSLSQKDREEALKEAKVLSSLKHPNIVEYKASFQEKGCFYIVMEYADGGDLSQKIQRQRKTLIPEEEILHDFIQISLAIKYIHDRKILHRDLKTQNIFLTKEGNIKLGDFGIAKVLENTFQFCKTQIGTPYYLSPEICEGKEYNSKTDIWSLGCILYELCTLQHAFEGSSLKGLLMNIICGKYTPISTKYSQDLRDLVSKMLTKNPSKRPTINQILSLPFIKPRLHTLLDKTLLEYEMNHTILHGRKPLSEPTIVLSKPEKNNKETKIAPSSKKSESPRNQPKNVDPRYPRNREDPQKQKIQVEQKKKVEVNKNQQEINRKKLDSEEQKCKEKESKRKKEIEELKRYVIERENIKRKREEEQHKKQQEEELKQKQLKEEELKQQKRKEEELRQKQLKEEELKQQKRKEEELKQKQLKKQQEEELRQKQLKEEELKQQKRKEEEHKAQQIKKQQEEDLRNDLNARNREKEEMAAERYRQIEEEKTKRRENLRRQQKQREEQHKQKEEKRRRELAELQHPQGIFGVKQEQPKPQNAVAAHRKQEKLYNERKSHPDFVDNNYNGIPNLNLKKNINHNNNNNNNMQAQSSGRFEVKPKNSPRRNVEISNEERRKIYLEQKEAAKMNKLRYEQYCNNNNKNKNNKNKNNKEINEITEEERNRIYREQRNAMKENRNRGQYLNQQSEFQRAISDPEYEYEIKDDRITRNEISEEERNKIYKNQRNLYKQYQKRGRLFYEPSPELQNMYELPPPKKKGFNIKERNKENYTEETKKQINFEQLNTKKPKWAKQNPNDKVNEMEIVDSEDFFDLNEDKNSDNLRKLAISIKEALDIDPMENVKEENNEKKDFQTFKMNDMEINLPIASDNDSLYKRAEAIRNVLLNRIGNDNLQMLNNELLNREENYYVPTPIINSMGPDIVCLAQQLICLEAEINQIR